MLCKASWTHSTDEEAAVCKPVSDKSLNETEIPLKATETINSDGASQV